MTIPGSLQRTGQNIALLVGLLSGLLVLQNHAAEAATGGSCRQFSHNVALQAGGPQDQTIRGTYCQPTTWAPGGRQLDVLVHGATYNRTYWDWPAQSPQYSYATKTLQAGRAVVFYDRIGTGTSSKPAATLINSTGEAQQLEAVIQRFQQEEYDKVNVIGHSMGARIAIRHAATYKSADRLVVTGLFNANGPAQATAPTKVYPATLDPKFAGTVTDPGYLTTRPGEREGLFFAGSYDKGIVASDEDRKDMVSGTSFGTTQAEFETPAPLNLTQGVRVPVLSIDGERDALTCGQALNCKDPAAVQASEAAYYGNTPSLTTKVVADTGHTLALHRTANTSFTLIDGWIKTH